MLELVTHQVRLGDRALGVEQLGEADAALVTGDIFTAAEQEPAAALDDLARGLVALQTVGLIDTNAVDDLSYLATTWNRSKTISALGQ
jgi:hypothetical protein